MRLDTDHREGRGGFTLIEILAVVAILGILMGLVAGSLGLARERAKRLKVATAVKELQSMWLAYRQDYGRFPSVEITEMDEIAVAILRGDAEDLKDRGLYNENPAGTPYLDLRVGATAYSDIWRRPYQVRLDDNYDNEVSVPPSTWAPAGSVRAAVAVWSQGKDGDDGTADDIASWTE